VPPVLLASLPFGPLRSPSLGLSLLQAGLRARGLDAALRYFTLDFARRIGAERYRRITGHWFTPDLLGEWVFAEALQGRPLDDEAFRRQVLLGGDPAHAKTGRLRPEDPEGLWADLQAARAEVPAFLEACVEAILAARPRVLGLTSVFEQTAASLALAAQVKARAPDLLVVLGGANAEGEMGRALFEAYPFLDAVVSGEAEHSFPAAMEAYLATGRVPRFPGYLVRDTVAGEGVETSPQEGRSMDDLPVPAFDDFFDQAEGLDLGGSAELLFETSRGCWWGQKQHCTFCGLNGASMAFRSKSPERAHGELAALTARHPGLPVAVVDNILDHGYFRTLLPRLAAEGPKADLFWEVKANLTPEQLRLLAAAGVRRLQPGLESLSDEGLGLMRKGVSALQNIHLLRRCAELGLDPAWSLLVGFPGEDPAEVQRMADLLPQLHHLKPPALAARIRLDRFSPNFTEAAARGLVNLRAYPSYGFVHGLPPAQLDRLAYYFAYDYADGREVAAYLAPLEAAVAQWQAAAKTARLVALVQPDGVLVFDGRSCATAPMHLLQGAEAAVLAAAASPLARSRLEAQLAPAFPPAELQAAVKALEAKHLLLALNGSLLALPLVPPAPAQEQAL
jgi:ribosomal peptide maturation radical SAM protein 1